MPVTLFDHINANLDGGLKKLLVEWHTKEGVGSPTIAKRLTEAGYNVEQRTVHRWLKKMEIKPKGRK
jgi:repressor of nif and glnA expression